MAKTTVTSTQFRLNLRDLLKGLLVAVITPVFTIIMTSLNAGQLMFNWKIIGATAVAAGLAYIVKNFLSPGTVLIPDAEVAKAVKEGTAEVKVTNT